MSHFYLQGFHDVDIVKSLKEIAEKNTVFHKADFLIENNSNITDIKTKVDNIVNKIFSTIY